jgi:hypothetical protein
MHDYDPSKNAEYKKLIIELEEDFKDKRPEDLSNVLDAVDQISKTHNEKVHFLCLIRLSKLTLKLVLASLTGDNVLSSALNNHKTIAERQRLLGGKIKKIQKLKEIIKKDIESLEVDLIRYSDFFSEYANYSKTHSDNHIFFEKHNPITVFYNALEQFEGIMLKLNEVIYPGFRAFIGQHDQQRFWIFIVIIRIWIIVKGKFTYIKSVSDTDFADFLIFYQTMSCLLNSDKKLYSERYSKPHPKYCRKSYTEDALYELLSTDSQKKIILHAINYLNFIDSEND